MWRRPSSSAAFNKRVNSALKSVAFGIDFVPGFWAVSRGDWRHGGGGDVLRPAAGRGLLGDRYCYFAGFHLPVGDADGDLTTFDAPPDFGGGFPLHLAVWPPPNSQLPIVPPPPGTLPGTIWPSPGTPCGTSAWRGHGPAKGGGAEKGAGPRGKNAGRQPTRISLTDAGIDKHLADRARKAAAISPHQRISLATWRESLARAAGEKKIGGHLVRIASYDI